MTKPRGLSACFFLSFLGMALAAYMAYLHLGLMRGELLGGAVCSGTGPFNCHAVTAGSWGKFLGMPLSLWGCIGYAAVFALACLGQYLPDFAEDALKLIVVFSAAFLAIDAALLALMVFVIRFFCLFCLATYAINLLLLVCAARALGPSWRQALSRIGSTLGALAPSRARPAIGLFWAMMLLGVAGTVAVHASTIYISQGGFGVVRKQVREFIASRRASASTSRAIRRSVRPTRR